MSWPSGQDGDTRNEYRICSVNLTGNLHTENREGYKIILRSIVRMTGRQNWLRFVIGDWYFVRARAKHIGIPTGLCIPLSQIQKRRCKANYNDPRKNYFSLHFVK